MNVTLIMLRAASSKLVAKLEQRSDQMAAEVEVQRDLAESWQVKAQAQKTQIADLEKNLALEVPRGTCGGTGGQGWVGVARGAWRFAVGPGGGGRWGCRMEGPYLVPTRTCKVPLSPTRARNAEEALAECRRQLEWTRDFTVARK